MIFTYECWEGKLPLVETFEPEGNVVFLNIYYDKRHIKLNGLDYYFAYGNIAGGWTDPCSAKWLGRKYTFDNNRVAIEDLTEPPIVESFHTGILIPDAAAKELNLI